MKRTDTERYKAWRKGDRAKGRALRERMVEELGGECVHCGSRNELQLDCVEPRWRHADCGGSALNRRVWHEYAAGNVQLLCGHCNRVKGTRAGFIPRIWRELLRELERMERYMRCVEEWDAGMHRGALEKSGIVDGVLRCRAKWEEES